MTSLSFEQLYGAMIAGSVATHAGDVEQSASYAAADALDTTSVHYHFFREKGAPRAYYFAVPSKALASNPTVRTPLTAAIPGAPGHQGDGAYVVTSNGLAAAAIMQEGGLSLLMNSEDVILRHLEETGVPVFMVDDLEGGVLTSSRSRGRGAAEKLSATVSKVSVFALGLGVAAAFGLNIANGYLEGKVEDDYRARSEALAKVTQDMSFNSPLSQQVSRMHALAAIAIKSGGTIDKFQYKGGVTTYELSVPKDAEDSAVKALGPGHESIPHDDLVVLSFDDSKPIQRVAAVPPAGKASGAKPGTAAARPSPNASGTLAATPTAQKVAAK